MRKILYLICTAVLIFCVACEPNNIPLNDPIVGLFSVGPNRQVSFAPGNLQYLPINATWQFAAKQTDYIGMDNKLFSATYDGWVDLLTWGNALPTNNTLYDPTVFRDWGEQIIGPDTPNTWRTLTSDEWQYLCFSRNQAAQRIAIACVDGINGLILLPDSWGTPEGIDLRCGFSNMAGQSAFAQWQTISLKHWEKLQHAGAIFLPAAGLRIDSGVYTLQYDGYYWAASAHNTNYSFCLVFDAQGVKLDSDSRHYGMAVRLVKDY